MRPRRPRRSRATASAPVARRPWSWFASWLALLSLLLGLGLSSSAGAAPPPDQRTGTTVVDPPSVAPPVDAAHAPPGDAPRFDSALPELPAPPAAFNTYDGGWVRFAYEPSVRERVQPLIAAADAVKRELSDKLGQPVLAHAVVYVARTPGEMATLAPAGAPYPKYAAGVAYPELGLVLLTINPVSVNDAHDLGEVFRHELTHVALHDAVEGHHVPRWFNEGFAVNASGESRFMRLRTLWTATLADTLLPLDHLERSFPADAEAASVAYAEAADVVRFLVRSQDSDRFTSMIARVRRGAPFGPALQDAYGTGSDALEHEWREDVARRYSFWPVFFSGSFIWVGAFGLIVWGWRRKKQRSQTTLKRWAREEAAEDELRRRLAAAREEQQARVHIVLAQHSERPPLPKLHPSVIDPEIPKVEHDGSWYTLH